MRVGFLKETAPGERRVAVVPSDIGALVSAGCTVVFERGAGVEAGFPDADYEARGAEAADRAEVFAEAEIVLSVRAGASAGEAGITAAEETGKGAVVVGLLDPYDGHESFTLYAEKGCTLYALELLPRITRAQSMDVLSSQANLAGYRAVILAAELLPRMFPMMMTAAGTLAPARVFVLGAGVAGLQAIATSRRLGGVVSAYDVREAAAEQVESLGAKFVRMELQAAEGTGGYARAMDEEFYRRQRELLQDVVSKSDVVITTAAVPGKPSPILVTGDMVEEMKPGSVIIDLAAERGGNCELSVPGATVVRHGVTIAAPLSPASAVSHHASRLYSKNITVFLLHLLADGGPDAETADEIRTATCIMRNGVMSGRFAGTES